MVDAKRLGAVLTRRINAAMARGDNSRAGQLKSMRASLSNGRRTAGQVLLDLQVYRKVFRKPEPVIKHRKCASSNGLRGGL
jgi:hypothetical protein